MYLFASDLKQINCSCLDKFNWLCVACTVYISYIFYLRYIFGLVVIVFLNTIFIDTLRKKATIDKANYDAIHLAKMSYFQVITTC